MNTRELIQVVVMRGCRLVHCNKCTAVAQDVVSGGRLLVYGKEGLWKLSVLSTQFCCECKTTLKTTQHLKRSRQQEKSSFNNYTQLEF